MSWVDIGDKIKEMKKKTWGENSGLAEWEREIERNEVRNGLAL